MKEKAFKVSVPQPCTQDWQGMQPDEKGRYCLSCRKSVVDFTEMTDQEVYSHLAQSSGKVCGRLRPTQLRKYAAPGVPGQPSPWRLYLASVVALMGFEALVPGTAKAQVRTEQSEPEGQPAAQPAHPRDPAARTIAIRGKVTSTDDGMGLPGATVVVKGTSTGTAADQNGVFELHLPEWTDPTIPLVYSFIGYQSVECVVSTAEAATVPTVAMEPDIMGGIVVGEVAVTTVKYPFPENVLMFPVKVFYKAKCLFVR
jgi:hypothetical protein